MTARKRRTTKRRRGQFYIALEFWELESPAFAHLTPDATRVYLFMRKRLNFDAGNNGEVRYSHRDAQNAIGTSNWRRGSNALAELRHYGFTKLRNGAEIGSNIRLECEWQLTAFPCGGQSAAKTFMHWDGDRVRAALSRQGGRGNESDSGCQKTASHLQHGDAPSATWRRSS